jgi:hypothetical protein
LLYKEWCMCVFQLDHAKVTACLVKAYSLWIIWMGGHWSL